MMDKILKNISGKNIFLPGIFNEALDILLKEEKKVTGVNFVTCIQSAKKHGSLKTGVCE